MDHDDVLSRTRKKQWAKNIEQVAERLVDLAENQLRQLSLSATLAEEIEQARTTRGRGSRRRQIKYLAGLLRDDEESASLLSQLEGLDQVTRAEKKHFHQLEDLRDRVCRKDTFAAALAEIQDQMPEIDFKTLSSLARSVHEHNDRRAYREIFRRLRDMKQQAGGED